jgi:HK97 family phage prohead protease
MWGMSTSLHANLSALERLEDTLPGARDRDGKLVLSVGKAKEAYDLLKANVLRGLSIGYDAIKSDYKDGVRYLRELKLFEVSLVVMPMNELATVQTVKAQDPNLDWHLAKFREVLAECRKSWQ